MTTGALTATISPTVEGAIIAAVATLIVAAVGGLLAFMTRNGQRRRDLYSEAYKTTMAWREMVYRVRRRAASAEADQELINRFHDLQERLDYFQGWIASESRWMVRSYCRLVEAVKEATREPIVAAWKEEKRRHPWEGTLPEDYHPVCKEATDRFLADVHWHLSLLVPMRLVVVWRNRKWLGGSK
jgi:hypothetical protein